ncbi:MAG: hypothetical protein K0R33_3872 [Mycobacterium sp.]|jgi:uncharacterized protein (DUF305 family)|nr:hypothetical protein [Mycobacterium sp.]
MSRTGLLAALAVAALISGCGGQESTPAGSAGEAASETATLTPGVNAADRAFAYGMLAQRPQIDQLVALARTNSGNPSMVAMAETLAVSEKQQSETINALLVQWTDGEEGGQGPPPAGPTLFDRGAVERLGSLQGPEFDKLWLQVMLNHHQAVMTMASSEISEGEDVNAKTLAQAIITTRQEEIVHMQQLMGGSPR